MAKETSIVKSTPEETVQTAAASTAINVIEVVLIAAHEHGGELKQPGDSISVNPKQQDWLRSLGKIK